MTGAERCDTNREDGQRRESIFEHASAGDLSGLRNILQDYSSISALVDSKGSTPLHFAAGNGRFEVCRFLLERAKAGYANRANRGQGRTALHWAARNGHPDTCRLLLEHGASVDALARGGVTPLQLAVWMGRVEVCKLLADDFGADKKFVNGWGCTVHHWLGKSVIYSNEKEDQNDAEERLIELCEWLDDNENDHSCWTRPNDHGQTPLHKAGFGGNLPVLRFLLETKGIADTHRDVQHNTAADCAERNKQWEAAKYLRRHGNPRCLQRATRVLFSAQPQPQQPPLLTEVKEAFHRLAKDHHPDRTKRSSLDTNERNNSTPSNKDSSQWSAVKEAYRLWALWWKDPNEADALIRSLERHELLQRELPPLLLWHPEWHSQHDQTGGNDYKGPRDSGNETNTDQHGGNESSSCNRDLQPNRFSKKPKLSSPFSPQATQALNDFERRLVCLLKTLPDEKIPLSQLPKEYQKTWSDLPMIRPRDYRCKKLGYLLETHCSKTLEVLHKDPSNAMAWVRLKKAG